MKFSVVYLLLIVGLISCQTNDNCIYKDYEKVVDLDTVDVWNKVKTVEVWSFKNYLKNEEDVIKDGKPTLTPTESIALSKKQTEKLKHILYSYTPQQGCEGWGMGYDCIFNPHHSLIFYDDKQNPIAHIEICFTCYEIRGFNIYEDKGGCKQFYTRLNSLFSSAGIKEYLKMGIEYPD